MKLKFILTASLYVSLNNCTNITKSNVPNGYFLNHQVEQDLK